MSTSLNQMLQPMPPSVGDSDVMCKENREILIKNERENIKLLQDIIRDRTSICKSLENISNNASPGMRATKINISLRLQHEREALKNEEEELHKRKQILKWGLFENVKILSEFGTVDPEVLIPKNIDMLNVFCNVIHRTVYRNNKGEVIPTIAIIVFVSKPIHTKEKLEQPYLLLVEAPASQVSIIADSWLYQCLLETYRNATELGSKLSDALEKEQYMIQDLIYARTYMNSKFLDREKRSAGMVLGIRGKDLPTSLKDPNDSSVIPLVTARLLTVIQRLESSTFQLGKRPLAARFLREGSHHISSIESLKFKDELIVPNQLPAHDPRKSLTKWDDTDAAPDPLWNVSGLIARVIKAQMTETQKGIATTAAQSSNNISFATTAVVIPPNAAAGLDIANPTSNTAGLQKSSSPRLYYDSIAAQKKLMPANSNIPTTDAEIPLGSFPTFGDIQEYLPPVPAGARVENLLVGGVANILSAMMVEIRHMLNPRKRMLPLLLPTPALRAISETLKNTLENQLILKALETCSQFMDDLSVNKPSELTQAFVDLQEQAYLLIKRLIRRAEWLRVIFQKKNIVIATRFFIEVLGTDAEWIQDANAFIKAYNERDAELLSKINKNRERYGMLIKEGVAWPHSVPMRRDLTKTGFDFKPMVFRTDRSICSVCNIQMHSWRPWTVPEILHEPMSPYDDHPHRYIPDKETGFSAEISILIAFQRANQDNPLKDSILPLIPEIVKLVFSETEYKALYPSPPLKKKSSHHSSGHSSSHQESAPPPFRPSVSTLSAEPPAGTSSEALKGATALTTKPAEQSSDVASDAVKSQRPLNL